MSFRRVDFPKVGILCQLFLVGDKIKRTIGFFYVTYCNCGLDIADYSIGGPLQTDKRCAQ